MHFALTAGVLAGIAWILTRPAGDVLRRTIAIAPFLTLAAFGWSHRPYVMGLICLAGVLLAADGRLDPRWLIPAGWVWLNSHGSWPLGLLAASVLWLGTRLDRRDASTEKRTLVWLSIGLVAGSVSPYGPRLLAFPLVALDRSEAFRRVVEWKAPTFTDWDELVFLVVIAAAVVALRITPTWRRALPIVVFVGAALVSARNVQVAALVLLPGIAEGLYAQVSDSYRMLARPVAVVAAGLAAVALTTAMTGDPFGGDRYPVAATAFLEAEGIAPTAARVIAPDFVGNFWEARYGRRARVFVDDRVELFPLDVLDDYAVLVAAEEGWDEALRRYEPAAVLWQRDQPLTQLLRLSEDFRIAYEDDRWVVSVAR